MNDQNFTFEKAYERLEKILETLNSGDVSLDISLKLYEEADQLIRLCQSKLVGAEQKIQMLIKNRNGSLSKTPEGQIQTQNYQAESNQYVNRNLQDNI